MLKFFKPRYFVLLALAILLGYGLSYLNGIELNAELTSKEDEVTRLNAALLATNRAIKSRGFRMGRELLLGHMIMRFILLMLRAARVRR